MQSAPQPNAESGTIPLTALFGNALKPSAGIACAAELKALLAAAEAR